MPRLTDEQIGPYLAANRRSAGSLLAASRVTGDKAWLLEAMEKYPNDPRVNFVAVFKSGSPETRRQWLEAFRKSAPDNALPFYLSALDAFKAGNLEEAVTELAVASTKRQYQDYSLDFIQNAQEAYQSAGYSEAEAKVISSSELPLPQLAQLKQVGRNIADMVTTYRQAGDEASAQALLQMGMTLSQRAGSGQSFLINDLLGIAIERQMLGTMDPSSLLDNSGQTVQTRLDELTKRRDAIKAWGKQAEGVMPTMSETDLANYFERMKTFGESSAMQWLAEKYGTP
ncbi:MAG TPA: hypothetical protein VEC99_13065 [Clostridia bacterium]|nr:hypothetical protein [Clostridia bacterium]